MRLGELSDEQRTGESGSRGASTWLWLFISGLFAVSGLSALVIKSGPVVCAPDGQRACVIERIVDIDWWGASWRTIDAGSMGVALPMLEYAHEIDLTRQESQIPVQAWTSDGLPVGVRSLAISHSVNTVDALDLLCAGGATSETRIALVEEIGRATTQYVIGQLPIEQLIGGRPTRMIENALSGPLGDALAGVGVELRTIRILGIETGSEVARTVERIRAGRTRVATAQDRILELQQQHRATLKKIENTRDEQLKSLKAQFTPRIKDAHATLKTRTLSANAEFRKRRQFAELQREVEQIRLEALRSAARHNNGALSARVKALANAGPELLDLEIAERVMGGLGQSESRTQADGESK